MVVVVVVVVVVVIIITLLTFKNIITKAKEIIKYSKNAHLF